MDRRLQLHEELCSILGSRHAYFQPPESVKLSYPCIIYGRNNADTKHADNVPYLYRKQYELTIITKDPDDPLVDAVATHFQSIRFNRHYTADNLNHDVFLLYW